MSKTGTTESGTQVRNEEGRKMPYDRPSILDGSGAGRGGDRAAGEAPLSGATHTPMGVAMGGLTGGDLGGSGYHGSTGMAGGAADYSGSRYGGGREQEELGLAGASGFGHTTKARPNAPAYANMAHATGLGGETGYGSGLGGTGAQGAGASAETAHFASEGKAGIYETGAAGAMRLAASPDAARYGRGASGGSSSSCFGRGAWRS